MKFAAKVVTFFEAYKLLGTYHHTELQKSCRNTAPVQYNYNGGTIRFHLNL